MMKVKEITYKSKSGLCDIWARECIDTDKPKGVVQLIHGMCEHSLRYNEFIQKLCDAGYVVFMADSLGHGRSVASKDDFGYFGDENGYKYLVEDAYYLTQIAKKEYPDLPYIMFGHSMGSFICRQYCFKYGKKIDGAIFCGTCGKNPIVGAGLKLANFIKRTKGDRFRSKMLTNMAFALYNKRTENKTNSDWLTRDEALVKSYEEDELTGFCFTANGYITLFNLVKIINLRKWFNTVPKELPILLTAGKEDPVGDFGHGVEEVYKKLIDTGHSDVTLNLYDSARHEILNELNKEEVYADIISWIDHTAKSS